MKHGTYALTKDGLKKLPDKWIKTNIGGKDLLVAPHHPMYNTITHYGKYELIDECVIDRMKETADEGNGELEAHLHC